MQLIYQMLVNPGVPSFGDQLERFSSPMREVAHQALHALKHSPYRHQSQARGQVLQLAKQRVQAMSGNVKPLQFQAQQIGMSGDFLRHQAQLSHQVEQMRHVAHSDPQKTILLSRSRRTARAVERVILFTLHFPIPLPLFYTQAQSW
ncbi:MAG TPA: hypothetical protein ENN99_10200 [Chloroflexi bacterium]|nr:hypothetical protein [Chloroflexota bacterium]